MAAPAAVEWGSIQPVGWRLLNGTVICSRCCRRPADAVEVVLVNGADGPAWVEAEKPDTVPVRPPPTSAPVAGAKTSKAGPQDPEWL